MFEKISKISFNMNEKVNREKKSRQATAEGERKRSEWCCRIFLTLILPSQREEREGERERRGEREGTGGRVNGLSLKQKNSTWFVSIMWRLLLLHRNAMTFYNWLLNTCKICGQTGETWVRIEEIEAVNGCYGSVDRSLPRYNGCGFQNSWVPTCP